MKNVHELSDKELTELAAHSIGFKITYNYLGSQNANCTFYPLIDDSDAFALIVYHGMLVDTDYNGGVICGNAMIEANYDNVEIPSKTSHATRRSIVKCAAKIALKKL